MGSEMCIRDSYYAGRGVSSFEGRPFDNPQGSEHDTNTLLIKSGADFHDLSEIELVLSPRRDAVRRRTVEHLNGTSKLTVRRHETKPSDSIYPPLAKTLESLITRIRKSTNQEVAYSLTPWDARAMSVRLGESALGDFIADIMLLSMGQMARAQGLSLIHI